MRYQKGLRYSPLRGGEGGGHRDFLQVEGCSESKTAKKSHFGYSYKWKGARSPKLPKKNHLGQISPFLGNIFGKYGFWESSGLMWARLSLYGGGQVMVVSVWVVGGLAVGEGW